MQYNADLNFADANLNVSNLTDLSLEAVELGAKIIVHPEGSTWGYATHNTLWCLPGEEMYGWMFCVDVSLAAEPIPGGPTTGYWESFAAMHDVYVIYHVPEVEGGDYFNSVGIVGPEGFVSRYRKRELYSTDLAYAQEGTESVIFETEYGDFGMMICMDGTYNGVLYDEYVEAGVDGIILSMNWDEDPDGSYAAATWFTERAADNNIIIYASDVSAWDGTAKYLPDGTRERNGLPDPAVGIDGLSLHLLE